MSVFRSLSYKLIPRNELWVWVIKLDMMCLIYLDHRKIIMDMLVLVALALYSCIIYISHLFWCILFLFDRETNFYVVSLKTCDVLGSLI